MILIINFILIIIIIIIIIIVKKYLKNKLEEKLENNTEETYNIGNQMSIYYHNMIICILQKKDFINNYIITTFFYNKLPNFIPWSELEPIYELFNKGRNNKDIVTFEYINSIESCSLWHVTNSTIEYMWICMKPLINKIYTNAFIKSNLVKSIDKIIIHFRCADTPFVRHPGYHFQKYTFFKNALNKLTLNISNKNIIILYNNSHLSDNKNQSACDIYVESLKKYLSNLDYNVTIESKSQLDDFATLFYAPAVISTSSSFSFISGYFGNNNNNFISATHYLNNNMCNDCGEWIYNGYDLHHDNVIDYYDTKKIITQLTN